MIVDYLHDEKIDFIVLAGFLWLIPQNILKYYGNNHILNIHPALLPKYGGKGMFGMNVHNAVIADKEKESGITIHFVNEKYDEGKIIFQVHCSINGNDTPDTLAEKIHDLEYEYYTQIIESILNQR
jgi:phosphoribosylglycinamide formyltransferase-1